MHKISSTFAFYMNKHMTTLLLLLALFFGACSTDTNSASTDTTNTVSSVQQNSYENIDAKTFMEKMKDSTIVVIDVRTPGEVKSGYIKGADLFIDINGSDFSSKINALDKSKTYLMYCRSGARSGRASSFMVQNGFSSVYNLNGGIMNYPGEITR